jgi:hypothetical protein
MPTTHRDFNVAITLWIPTRGKHETIRARVDCGCDVPLILRHDHVRAWGLEPYLQPYSGGPIDAANGTAFDVRGKINLYWTGMEGSSAQQDEWHVVKRLPYDAVIGADRWDEIKEALPSGVLGPVKQFECSGRGIELVKDPAGSTIVWTEWEWHVTYNRRYRKGMDAQGMESLLLKLVGWIVTNEIKEIHCLNMHRRRAECLIDLE